ncbi:2-phospho-L-lactate transferase [Subtercola sp. Z020]|uniref:2-phospho-L-lactate transferase n=1 Tax=Subtercola sp. Z020 TaxID=2080582 RepID=UPI000CE77F75|nr:2-phospho-L-lactate transferase [Subtercola sp. Z020]PPF84170.1 2-phospho-L-lactate transferase [Subtercola sp. Z020]
MKITVLAGGVGGAKFLRGLRQHLRETLPDGAGGTTATVTVVVNTGDDLWLTGLRVCPDLDSIMYTLGGANDEVRGWGRLGESERVSAELTAYGVGWPWFTLGDLDLGTHITRSHLLREGLTLSEATAQVTARWNLGVTLLPMSDQPVETHVVVADEEGTEPGSAPGAAPGTRTMHFEEWWVRYRASLPALRFEQHGIETAVAAPGVVDAILDADVVLVAPSNPVVSIGTILPVPGMREALLTTSAPVVGVSPIISGSPVRGMAKACLDAIGVAVAADAVALHYGARGARSTSAGADAAGTGSSSGGAGSGSGSGILDAWLIDESDAALAPGIEAAGLAVSVVPLWMTTVDATAALAAAALAAADGVRLAHATA